VIRSAIVYIRGYGRRRCPCRLYWALWRKINYQGSAETSAHLTTDEQPSDEEVEIVGIRILGAFLRLHLEVCLVTDLFTCSCDKNRTPSFRSERILPQDSVSISLQMLPAFFTDNCGTCLGTVPKTAFTHKKKPRDAGPRSRATGKTALIIDRAAWDAQCAGTAVRRISPRDPESRGQPHV